MPRAAGAVLLSLSVVLCGAGSGPGARAGGRLCPPCPAMAAAPIRLELRALQGAPREPLHLLPCALRHDGPAPVGRYFTPAVRQGARLKSVSFRGRRLLGQDLPVPTGYVGLVLKEDEKPCSEDEERRVRVKSTFTALTAWTREQAPSADDALQGALGWPHIAQAIHAPVADEEGP
ncbi:ribonuclease H2 subunit C [Alligator mississippiensis]|uniref:ribonuclease H2 subunit C n=1 Tax=Alligator mississippiensis TaxID=8496 RepID=UPI0028777F67|nr:ribonuclease H2 subunit C [Alligator mississippiensis]